MSKLQDILARDAAIKDEMAGALARVSPEIRELTVAIVSFYHYRDGAKNPDGSVGTIRISPAQLNDCIAWALTYK